MTSTAPKSDQESSLQKRSEASSDLQRLQSQLDELKDMADLLPVLASVQEHLEAEKLHHQKRMMSMMILFAVMFGFFLIAPIYLGRALLEQSRDNVAAQQALQAEFIQAVQGGGAAATLAEEEVRAQYQAELAAEKARMRGVLETLILEVDAAITAASE